MEFPMIMLHLKKKKKIEQNFAKILSASVPVNLDSLAMKRMTTTTLTTSMIMAMMMMTYWLQAVNYDHGRKKMIFTASDG